MDALLDRCPYVYLPVWSPQTILIARLLTDMEITLIMFSRQIVHVH